MPDTSTQITPEEGELAAAQEELERLAAENFSLKNRVVVLRAFLNRAEEDLAVALADLSVALDKKTEGDQE